MFPFAPHLGSEVYEQLTGRRVWEEPWPEADSALLTADVVELVVQLNGKLIDRLEMPADASGQEQEQLARSSEKLAGRLDGKEIVKTIVVPTQARELRGALTALVQSPSCQAVGAPRSVRCSAPWAASCWRSASCSTGTRA